MVWLPVNTARSGVARVNEPTTFTEIAWPMVFWQYASRSVEFVIVCPSHT
jgi:hypothetical protein